MKNEKGSTYHTNHKYLKNPRRYAKYSGDRENEK